MNILLSDKFALRTREPIFHISNSGKRCNSYLRQAVLVRLRSLNFFCHSVIVRREIKSLFRQQWVMIFKGAKVTTVEQNAQYEWDRSSVILLGLGTWTFKLLRFFQALSTSHITIHARDQSAHCGWSRVCCPFVGLITKCCLPKSIRFEGCASNATVSISDFRF